MMNRIAGIGDAIVGQQFKTLERSPAAAMGIASIQLLNCSGGIVLGKHLGNDSDVIPVSARM